MFPGGEGPIEISSISAFYRGGLGVATDSHEDSKNGVSGCYPWLFMLACCCSCGITAWKLSERLAPGQP